MASEQNGSYTSEDITVLDGLEPLKRSRPSSPPIDLRSEKLHGITQEESDLRYQRFLRGLRAAEISQSDMSDEFGTQARLYISGVLSWESFLASL